MVHGQWVTRLLSKLYSDYHSNPSLTDFWNIQGTFTDFLLTYYAKSLQESLRAHLQHICSCKTSLCYNFGLDRWSLNHLRVSGYQDKYIMSLLTGHVSERLSKYSIELVKQHAKAGYYSRLFLVPKPWNK